MPKLSLVIPCFNEEKNIPLFYRECQNVLLPSLRERNTGLRFIFIDDGSTDQTLSRIKSLRKKDPAVHFISFSRNFGKEAALYAGLKQSLEQESDYTAVIDVDLQDPPELIPQMLDHLQTGRCDAVGSRRVNRKGESFLRSLWAKGFYAFFNRISSVKLRSGMRDFILMKQSMVQAVVSLPEITRFSKGIFSWVGYQVEWLEYNNIERQEGKSKWSFRSLFSYALEGIFSFTTLPLKLASYIGFILSLGSFSYLLYILISTLVLYLKTGVTNATPGFPTLASALFFLGGIQLIFLGILGEYIARIYMETKRRPLYIEKENSQHQKREEPKEEYDA